MRVKKLICAMLVLAIALTGCVAVACNKKEKEYPERGTYYSDTALGELQLVLEGKNFNIIEETGTKSGTYKLSGESLELKVSKKEKYSATYKDDTVKMTYGNYGDVTLVRKKTYAVKFIVEGQDDKVVYVLNGRTLAKPDDPVVAGKEFLGWYLDEAGTQPYSGFGTAPVKGELTLYAKFSSMTRSAAEYTVSFDLNAEGVENNIPAVQTIGGRLYNLPTPSVPGKTFCGWWVSDFEDGNRLTYKCDETKTLDQDVTLFAAWEDPFGLQITSEGAIWDAETGARYSVRVETADSLGNFGMVDETNVTVGRYNAIDFDANAEQYRVTVSYNGKSQSRYYSGRALKRVSLFSVVDRTLLFKGVPGAEQYTLNIDCGNERHIHTAYNNGLSTVYDFSGCEMTDNGITFEVTASAKGYTSSTSKQFVYMNELDAIENIYVDEASETFTWPSVNNAMGYRVTVNNGTPIDIGNETSFSYKTYNKGNISFTVTPYADGYSSPAVATKTVTKSTLPAPDNLKVVGNTLSWSPIDGASGYTVTVLETGKFENTTTASVDLVAKSLINDSLGNAYTLTVQATGSGDNSLPSDGLDVICNQMYDIVTYSGNVLSWRYVVGAEFYRVYLNNSQVLLENDEPITTNNVEIELDREGVNEIEVCYVDENEIESEPIVLDVNAFKITLEYNDGSKTAPKYAYRATGDKMNLPKLEFDKIKNEEYEKNEENEGEEEYIDDPRTKEIEFADWYVDPTGAKGNARRVSEATFNGTSNATYYADWVGKTYKAQLGVRSGDNTCFVDSDFAANKISKDVQLSYNTAFTLPGLNKEDFENSLMKSKNAAYLFYGWYLDTYDTNNTLTSSVRLTDPYGVSLAPWSLQPDDEHPAQLTAHFEKIFNFTDVGTSSAQTSGAHKYQVDAASEYIADYTYLKIPAYYNDGPVTTLGANAFTNRDLLPNLTNLKRIDIPDTIDNIVPAAFMLGGDMDELVSLGNEKYIKGCVALEEINVYASGRSDAAKKYTSNSGVLFDGKNLMVFPAQHAISYVVPTGTTSIEGYAFLAASSLRSITIPTSVTAIQRSAFYSCVGLTEVKFASGGSGLTLAPNAFYGCASMRKIDLPEQLTSLAFRYNSKDDVGTVQSSNPYATSYKFSETFKGCTNLKEINIDPNNKNYESEDGMIYNKTDDRTKRVLYYVAEGLNELDAELTIKDVNEISDYAFFGFNRIKSVTFPNSLTKVGNNAFYNCTSLVSATLPSGVSSLGSYAFTGCTSLETIDFGNLNKINEYVCYDCRSLKEITIPDSVETIDRYAFFGCSGATTIDLGTGVKTIGYYSFGGASSVTELDIPDSVEAIEMYAFYGLTNLIRLELGANITVDTLTEEYVKGSNGITRMNYPTAGSFKGENGEYTYTTVDSDGNTKETKTELSGYYTFEKCDKIYEVCYRGNDGGVDSNNATATMRGNTVLQNQLYTLGLDKVKHFYKEGTTGEETQLKTLEKPEGNYVFFTGDGTSAVDAEGSSSANILLAYGGTATEITMPEFTDGTRAATAQYEIGEYAFAGNTTITGVKMDEKVSVIHGYAFRGCAALEEVDLKGVTDLGGNNENVALFDELPDGTTNIYTRSLKTLTIPSTVTHISKNCFAIEGYGENVYDNKCSLVEIINNSNCEVKVDTRETTVISKKDGEVEAEKASTIHEQGGFKFQVTGTESKTVRLIGYYGSETEITLPEKYNDTTATEDNKKALTYSIADYAFAYNKKLTSITIPDTVTEIGTGVFTDCENLTYLDLGGVKGELSGDLLKGCSALTTLKVGSGVTGISTTEVGSGSYEILPDCVNLRYNSIGNALYLGNDANRYQLLVKARDESITTCRVYNTCTTIFSNAFSGCSFLTSIDIPDSVTTIGESAFNGCRMLSSVRLSNTITTLSKSLFNTCKLLRSIDIPENVMSIGETCFFNSGVQFVNFLGNKVTSIGTSAFEMCPNLQSIKLPESLTSIGASAFRESALVNIVIPNSVTEIGDYAFSGTALVDVVIPDSVTKIGSNAFSNIKSLEKIHIGNGVETIGGRGLDANSDVRIEIDSENSKFELLTADGRTVISKDDKDICYYTPNKSIIPEGVKELPESFAAGDTTITMLALPSTLTTMDKNAFKGCTALTGINFASEDNTLAIGSSAFEGCTGLTSIDIKDNVKSIGTYAFKYCTGLETVTISSKNVAATGTNAFEGCTGLRTITFSQSATKVTTISNKSFLNCTALTTLTLPSTLTSISSNAFQDCTGLTGITFDNTDNKLSIGSSAFQGCTGLTSIDIKDNVKSIGSSAFKYCTGLKTVTISSKNVANTGSNAFEGCTGLETVTIGQEANKVTQISGSSFKYCTSLKTVTISNSDKITSIGSNAFEGCTSLTTFNLPTSLTTIGGNAFKNCKSLTEITTPEKVTSIGANVFEGCTGLTKIDIPKVTSIAASAFDGCTKLADVLNGDEVTSIGNYAFRGCAFENLNLPFKLASIGMNAFQNNLKLKTLSIPASVNDIKTGAFAGCTELEKVLFMPSAMTQENRSSSTLKISAGIFDGCTKLFSSSGIFFFNGTSDELSNQNGCIASGSTANAKIKDQLFGENFNGQTKFYYRCECADGEGECTGKDGDCKDKSCWRFDEEGCEDNYDHDHKLIQHVVTCDGKTNNK